MGLITSLEQILEIKEASKKSGKRVKCVVNKQQLLRENPSLAQDPRMALTPDNYVLDVTPLETITVMELRQLCAKASDSLLATSKAASVAGLSDNTLVSLLKEDLDELASASKPKPAPKPK